jgi:hypothetical protein
VDRNLVLWQQLIPAAGALQETVRRILRETYFADVLQPDRPFSVFGYVDTGTPYLGAGWDGIVAHHVCGYADVHMDNIYLPGVIRKHFGCGHNVANDPQLQLALRAVEGLGVSALTEEEKEHAAKAVASGYLYREGDVLYTKILVSDMADDDRLFAVSDGLERGVFDAQAKGVAERLAALIRRTVPDYLLGEWTFANDLAALPVVSAVVEYLIERGVLTPPADGIGAEGCWMEVRKEPNA